MSTRPAFAVNREQIEREGDEATEYLDKDVGQVSHEGSQVVWGSPATALVSTLVDGDVVVMKSRGR